MASVRGRRFFLKRTAVAAALASAAAFFAPLPKATRASPAAARPACPKMSIPMQEVRGKVAFITGGSSGIGLGIAHAFAEAGMKVVIGYRTKPHLDEAMQSLHAVSDQIHAISVDVTDRAGMERAAAETISTFGKVHVLVNNAGVAAMAPLDKTTYDDWDWVMSVNVTGIFNGVRAFLPHIQAHGEGGQIVSASSTGGLYCVGGAGVYAVSKFAVVGMMEALRADLAGANIGASVYCPGSVGSNLVDSDRNRPSRYSDVGQQLDPQTKAAAKKEIDDPELSITPVEMGRLVLRGMRNNDLYILTHPEYEQIIRVRQEALIASFPTDLKPSAARIASAHSLLEKSIYLTERDRHLCTEVRQS
jgi:NAD(P)-dependent dehydrogenase (short-subunit alcohol dehydrogenase family)